MIRNQNNIRLPAPAELKLAARQILAQPGRRMSGVTVVYLLATLAANGAVQGGIPETISVLGRTLSGRPVAYALTLLVDLLLGILAFGYAGLCLDNSRADPDLPITGLLAGTAIPFRVMGVQLLSGLLVLLTVFPATLPLIGIYLIAGSAGGGLWASVLYGAAIPVALWVLWFTLKTAASYALASFVLWDIPELTAMDCIRQSKELMRGHETSYIRLELSFIGWILLIVLSMGMAALYVMPWMQVCYALFYRLAGGDKVADFQVPGMGESKPEQPKPGDDIRAAFTTSAYRDREEDR